MTSLPPRVAIECIDDAIVLGKRQFGPLLRLGLLPFLGYSAISLYFYNHVSSYALRLLASVATYGLYALLEAATIAGAWDVLHGRGIDFRETWRQVSRHSPSVLLATWIKVLLVFLGTIMLVIPGIYFVAIYFAVPGINVIEGLGVRASLVRSRELALGSLKGIVLAIAGIWILVLIVALAIPRLLTELGVSPISVLRPLCELVWNAAIIPFRSALSARVYLEIRRRKEGYDLQRMMASLSPLEFA